jgi:hypothetical protein
MSGDEAVLAVIDALEALEIPYMVVGSLSTNLYGIPRSTEDADLVLQIGPQTLSQLADHLGPQFRLNPQASFETVTKTLRHILMPIGIPFKIELFHLSEQEHDQERFRRRLRMKMSNREVSAPMAEDVVITKVRWAFMGRRSKDRDDARDVISVQSERLNWNYVNAWCDRLGCRTLLDEIRRSIPAI